MSSSATRLTLKPERLNELSVRFPPKADTSAPSVHPRPSDRAELPLVEGASFSLAPAGLRCGTSNVGIDLLGLWDSGCVWPGGSFNCRSLPPNFARRAERSQSGRSGRTPVFTHSASYLGVGSSPAQVIAQNLHWPFSRRAAIVSSPWAWSLAFGPSMLSSPGRMQ